MRFTIKACLGKHTQLTDEDTNEIIQAVAREITEEFHWSHRYREAVIAMVAPVVAGTVTVTEGSPAVVGASTAWTAAMAGRRMTIAGLDAPLYVADVTDATHLNLGDAQLQAVNWPLVSGSGKSYSIFAAEYELPEDLAVVRDSVLEFPMEAVSQEYLDQVDPKRTSRGGKPQRYALVRTRVDGTPNRFRKFIEFWPVVSTAMAVRLPYLIEPPPLNGDLDLAACPSQLIELLATSRCADNLYSKTGDARWANLSDRYYRRYAGGGNDVGALEKMKGDDEARQPLSRRLYDGGAMVTYEYLQSHDPA